MYAEVCMWSSSRLARSLNRGEAVDSQWHHRALKLNYWPLGSSLGRTTPKQLAAVGFCSPHCHFKALLSPECNQPVFTFTSWNIVFLNCRIETVLIRKLTALVVSSDAEWNVYFVLTTKTGGMMLFKHHKTFKGGGWGRWLGVQRVWLWHLILRCASCLLPTDNIGFFLPWPQSFPHPFWRSVNCLNLNLNHG